jgi:16S rRNA (cytosine967-C5)-methyltransferase
MTPGAQIQASIELLEDVQDAWEEGRAAPVDAMLGNYFRQRRYIGAKDKGFISRRVYAVLRHGGQLQWHLEKSGLHISPRTLVLATLVMDEQHPINILQTWFSGNGHDAKPLHKEERRFVETPPPANDPDMPDWMRLNAPKWCMPRLQAVFGDSLEEELQALNEEAPLDLRVNTLKTTREDAIKALRKEGFFGAPTPYSPWGIRLEKRGALFATHVFRNGWVEVQDEGSQLTALLADAQPGNKVIDFCAGAGGKTLALAASMQNKGRILAWDTSETRLSQSAKRFARAGVDNVQRHVLSSETDPFIKRHKDSADVVMIDAPCSGSGTWRRNPDLKWRFSEKDLAETVSIQQNILESAQRLVKKGGKLLYITCSVFADENEAQIETFLNKHPEFVVAEISEIWNKYGCAEQKAASRYLRLSPYSAQTDGFFATVLHKS